MKGVILAGGLGSRLRPLTSITNKHLLPVYDRPMIYYPIQTLVEAGVQDIMLVTGGNAAGDFLRLLGNGEEFGLKHINYTYQKHEGGIAEALGLCRHFAGNDKAVVMLGDNILDGSIKKAVNDFEKQESGAKIFLKTVDNPKEYGVAELKGQLVKNIVEKPKNPKSNYAVIGIYMYDARVWNILKTLTPSGRGELEITDVNNAYIKKDMMTYEIIKGWWGDAGSSIEDLWRVNHYIGQKAERAKCRS
ncbi:NTP transferase domain-containing protein [candidate division TA06 bacterium]|uniref:glucose-1-phosphate thymidylyltransferase n=1 Tax=candidate division TA06 bacterium TaxID=2250710 RepID=A0A933MIK5_UNCT6|nr:NTP transferase domain-containing protein [candidate division TA06 bacterium]